MGNSDFARAKNPMPKAAHAIAAQTRSLMRSPRKSQLISATTAGMDAMMTPAEIALVMLTPYSMQIVNRKLPRKDSTKTSFLVAQVMTGSEAGLVSQCGIARPPMAKRNQASNRTGMAATSGLDNAT